MQVVLLNFLVAILEGTYKKMQEQGNFSFQCNQYQFIERYSIAFKDDWGYSELVLHPAPLNLFTLILVPAVFKKTAMKAFANGFGKFVFWLENMFYLYAFLVYEFCLIPILYIKISYNIIMQTSFVNMLYLLLFWALFGPFTLLLSIIYDVLLLFRTLCDPKDEDDFMNDKKLEDEKEDKVVIFYEIVQVVKLLGITFKNYERQRRKLLSPLDGYEEREEEVKNDKKRGLLMSKAIIIEAW